MSTKKISTKNLADAVAKRLGISQVAASKFLSEFQSVAENAILEDKILKISGLGTFKLVWNQPRKSVSVQTGEPIEIAGRYKLNFTPETELKNKVNDGVFDKSEQVGDKVASTNAPLKKLGEQAEELKGILQSINGESTGEPTEPEYAAPDLGQSVKQQEQSQEKAEEVVVKLEDLEPKKEPVRASDYVSNQPKCKKKRCCVIVWLVVIVVLLCGLGCAYYFWKEPIRQYCKSASETVMSWFACDKSSIDVSESSVVPEDTVVVSEDTHLETVVVAEPTVFDTPRTYTEFIATEEVTEGSRLAWIAYKHYGNKAFWVYIYEANKEILPNPNKLPIGCKVKIPKLPDYLIDINNPECLEYAKKLHEQYLQ